MAAAARNSARIVRESVSRAAPEANRAPYGASSGWAKEREGPVPRSKYTGAPPDVASTGPSLSSRLSKWNAQSSDSSLTSKWSLSPNSSPSQRDAPSSQPWRRPDSRTQPWSASPNAGPSRPTISRTVPQARSWATKPNTSVLPPERDLPSSTRPLRERQPTPPTPSSFRSAPVDVGAVRAITEEGPASAQNPRNRWTKQSKRVTSVDEEYEEPAYRQKDRDKAPLKAKLKVPKIADASNKAKAINTRKTNDVYIPSNISVANFARLLGVRHKQLQRKMTSVGMNNTDGDFMLSSDDAYLLALEFDRNPIVDDEAAFDLYPLPPPSDLSSLPLRPPVITIMGHVDHGKTTLLDTLRSASVAASEAGGITQHIGAFSVPVPSLSTSKSSAAAPAAGLETITFLDTPGHAAFTAMRARGAGVTDIIVLVVAADDGVMPQTKEVIALAKNEGKAGGDEDGYGAGVGLVVAINKCDKPGVDVSKVKHALLAEGVQLEEFGGDVPSVEVSGLTGLGLDKLVETLAILAEVKEIRARKEGRAEGRVLESRVDKGRGAVATILVTQGTLSTGSFIAAGTTWARVRQMMDPTSGKIIKSASAGTPVSLSGWKDLPSAGDELLEGKESEVKSAVENRKRNREIEKMQKDVVTINEKRIEAKEKEAKEKEQEEKMKAGQSVEETKTRAREEEGVKELRVIIKADVSGTAEAVVGAIEGIGNHLAKVRIISSSVGEPTEADVAMAQAIDAMIVGFNVKPSHKILHIASSSTPPVQVHTSSIIYRLMEEIRLRVQALLPPIIEQRVTGEALVQALFEISAKKGQKIHVAGCRVTNGTIERHKSVRVVRDGEVVYTGTLAALKQVKKDVLEMRKGTECGVSFEKFTDVQVGDKVQTFETVETPGQL